MRFKLKFVSMIILIAVMVTGCTSTTAPTSEQVMADKPADSEEMMDKSGDEEIQNEGELMDKSDDAMMEDKPGEEMEKEDSVMADEEAIMTEAPDWFKVDLTEVSSGETFTVESLKGQVVLVETMAQWCSSCLRQQKEVKVLHEQLGERDDFVSLGLNIDPNESAEALKDYVASNGFDWLYAVSPADVSREISNLYGAQFLNPPATPMLIIDRQGEVHILPFGVKSAQNLLEALQPFLDESM